LTLLDGGEKAAGGKNALAKILCAREIRNDTYYFETHNEDVCRTWNDWTIT
jgi:hypothetical protein